MSAILALSGFAPAIAGVALAIGGYAYVKLAGRKLDHAQVSRPTNRASTPHVRVRYVALAGPKWGVASHQSRAAKKHLHDRD